MGIDYKEAGVDIEKASESLKNLKASIESTFNAQVIDELGKFGGFYKINENQILISSIDGVGTKIKIAKLAKKLNIIGEDIVNHCVNDIGVHNATPLFFLDYVAMAKLDQGEFSQIIQGIVKACKENKCVLIGGETAEMPGIYSENMLDLAGAIVGIIDKQDLIDGKNIKAGDTLIGIESNGLHTNGFSLVNKMIEKNNLKIDESINELGDTLGNALITKHISYLPLIKGLYKEIEIKGLAHITGGGIHDNLIRIIPKGLSIDIDYNKIEILPIFKYIQKTGQIKSEEMFKVFNMGIGLIIVTNKKNLPLIQEKSKELLNRKAYIIGEVK